LIKLQTQLNGIKTMYSLPDVMIVVDQNHKLIAVR